MVNIIFILLFILGIGYGLLTNRVDEITKTLLSAPKDGVLIFFEMTCLLIFWSGILEVCKDSGLLQLMTKVLKKIISPLFKEISKDEKALDYISMNFAANLMGIGSAATPFGLKAMKELKRLNNNQEVASKSMITMISINTSGLCIIPSTVISLRQSYGSANSTLMIPYMLIICFLTLSFTILINGLFKKYAN